MYIFYLEPYTFIWNNESNILIYNSLSKEKVLIESTPRLLEIASSLQLVDNMYRITLDNTELKRPDVNEFVSKVREIFAGDIIQKSQIQAFPIIFPPKLNFQKDMDRIKEDDFVFLGDDILKYLKEVNIHVDGDCTNDCKDCGTIYKQYNSCTRCNSELTSLELIEFINRLSFTGISKLNIIGNRILESDKFDIIKDHCYSLNQNVSFNMHYLNIRDNVYKLKDSDANVIVNFPIKEKCFNDLILASKKYELKANYTFYITTETEYELSEELARLLELENFSIFPIYNKQNIDFFKNFVFMNTKDLLEQSLSKRQIFAHQKCNVNDFGKLILMPDGNIYANLFHEKIGHIQDDLKNIIYSEIANNKSWLRIRNMIPCKDCVYQWLCPSPSNYELVIGKPNLCHVKP